MPHRGHAPGLIVFPERALLPIVALIMLALIGTACSAAEPIVEPEEPGEAQPTLPSEEPSEEDEPSPAPTATLLPATPTAQPSPATPTPVVEEEERVAEVEWPSSMRVGDGEVLRLSLIVSSEDAHLTTPEIAGHQVETTTVPIPVTRTGYDGYVNASLIGAGLDVAAAGPTRQALAPGRPNTWRWTISAPRAGTYHLVINLTVSWEPQPGTDAPGPLEESVWSRVLTVDARAPLGLSGSQIDWLGLGGTVLGTVAGLPFVERVLSTFWRRLRGRDSRETHEA